MRIGQGYDVHRLAVGRNLVLGGVKIEYEMGLLGHSDADVLVHAVIDSLLGAAKLGDIGRLFPDNDNAYKNAVSLDLLRIVSEKVKLSGYSIINIDSTILAQEPKLKDYLGVMENNIANFCGIDKNKVSVKATTEEGLGFTGKKEGIAAHAVCLIE